MGELANITPSDQQIYHLRRAGHSFDDIALLTGMDKNDAIASYRGYMKKLQHEFSLEEREMHVQMEMSRLDELQQGIWDDAVSGDVKKVDAVLRIMAHRAKLLGFDKISPTPENVKNIILVSGSQQEFIEALRAGREEHVVTSSVVEDEGEEDDL